MVMDLLRNNRIIAGILALLRIYIGYKWFTAGIAKLTGGGFDATGFIKMASENNSTPTWWAAFLETIALPNAGIFSIMVLWGEIFVGLALILGVFSNFAALMGIAMNLSFLFSGSGLIDAQMAVLTVFILIAGSNAGRCGLDRWVQPILKQRLFHKKRGKEQRQKEMAVM